MKKYNIAILAIASALGSNFALASDQGCAVQKHYAYVNASSQSAKISAGGQQLYRPTAFHLYICTHRNGDHGNFWCGYDNHNCWPAYSGTSYNNKDNGCDKSSKSLTRSLMEFNSVKYNSPYALIKDFHSYMTDANDCIDSQYTGTSAEDTYAYYPAVELINGNTY